MNFLLVLPFLPVKDFPIYSLVNAQYHQACVTVLLQFRSQNYPNAYLTSIPMTISTKQEINAIKILLDPDADPATNAWCIHQIHPSIDATVSILLKNLVNLVPLLQPVSFTFDLRNNLYNSIKPFLLDKSDPIFSSWTCCHKWLPHNLHQTYGHLHFRCGEDDNGNDVLIKLSTILEYGLAQVDDTPIYIFDHEWNKMKENECKEEEEEDVHDLVNNKANDMVNDYNQRITEYFPDDLMDFFGQERPPHRWLLIGPKGSGTDVHQDPAGTVAWNFLISGQKLWVFIHPSLTSKQVYQGCNADDQPSLTWFTKYVHLIAKEHPNKIYLAMQQQGETILLPPGWWHAVYNVEDVVGVTENHVSLETFVNELSKCKNGESESDGEGDDDDKKKSSIVERVEMCFGLHDIPERNQAWYEYVKKIAVKRGVEWDSDFVSTVSNSTLENNKKQFVGMMYPC